MKNLRNGKGRGTGEEGQKGKRPREEGGKEAKTKGPLDGAGVSNKLVYPGMPGVHETSVREHAEGLLALLHAFLPCEM
jgi:hypothetical protein